MSTDAKPPLAGAPGSAYGYVCPGCGEQIYDEQDVVDTDDGMAHGDCVK